MTKDEAIELMGQIRDYLTSGSPIWRTSLIDEACSMAIEALEEHRIGKWIDMTNNGAAIRTPWWESGKCDKCGKYGSKAWDYCPHCGTKMEV